MSNAENFAFPDKVQQQNHQQYTPPVDIVELPSEGKLYPSDHPLHNKKTVEIYYMTTKQEDILVNTAYNKAGIVFDKLIESILVDRSINPDSLLTGDRSAIILNARINGYGADYGVRMSCEHCYNLNDLELDLSKVENKQIDYSKIKITPEGNIVIDLPKTKIKVEVKMLTGADEKELYEKTSAKEKYNLPQQAITERYSQMVKSVGGKTDPVYISNFVSNMRILDSRTLRKTYYEYVPDIDFTYKYECKSCEHVNEGGVPVLGNFFWPDE